MITIQSFSGLAPLLADREHWERLGDKFSGDNLQWQTSDLLGLAALGVAFFLLLLLLRWAGRLQAFAQKRGARKRLYRDLCAAHGLGWRHKKLMHKAQQELRLESPDELFVRPELFADATVAPKSVGAGAWLELGERLFAEEA